MAGILVPLVASLWEYQPSAAHTAEAARQERARASASSSHTSSRGNTYWGQLSNILPCHKPQAFGVAYIITVIGWQRAVARLCLGERLLDGGKAALHVDPLVHRLGEVCFCSQQ